MWPFASNETEHGGFHIEDVRQEVPEFRRIYTKQLDSRARIIVTIKWFMGSLSKYGELRQPNGRVVWFEPDRIADKILDPALVPLIQEAVDEIYRIDAAYRKPPPTEFIDKGGERWRRVTHPKLG